MTGSGGATAATVAAGVAGDRGHARGVGAAAGRLEIRVHRARPRVRSNACTSSGSTPACRAAATAWSGRSRPGAQPVAVGVLRTEPSLPTPERLAELQTDLRALLQEHRPPVVAIERVLFQVNARTAIPVAQAAGIAMAEAVAAGCEVVEYSPNQVKQAVAGVGGASKEQVERMVQVLLGISQPLRPVDAADAVALALCHLAHAPMRRRVAKVAAR